MGILLQTVPKANTPIIIYTAPQNQIVDLFITCVAPNYNPLPGKPIMPTEGVEMYEETYLNSSVTHYSDTISLALLPPGMTEPPTTNNGEDGLPYFLLFKSSIGHKYHHFNLNLAQGNSLFVISYLGCSSFNILG